MRCRFDTTALEYTHAICDDLGMRYVGSFSPEMRDLLHEEGQAQPTCTPWTSQKALEH